MTAIPRDVTPAFASPVATGEVRPKLMELLGLESVPTEADFTAEPSEVEGDVRLRRLRFANSMGETVPAVLCAPAEAEGPLPGVVCIPGTGGSAERIAGTLFNRANEPDEPVLGWSRELARRGYRHACGDRQGHGGPLAVRHGRRLEQRGQAAGDVRADPDGHRRGGGAQRRRGAGFDATASTPHRIGLTGMSLGGNATWYSMACDPSIAAGVPICGSPSSLDVVSKLGDPLRHSAYFYIPHMLRYFDHPDIVSACIAPRPFMMVAPTEDEDTPKEGVDLMREAVAPVYEAAGHPERFRVHQPAGRHMYRVEYFELMVNWFDRHLATA